VMRRDTQIENLCYEKRSELRTQVENLCYK
jgi:hypothetical protein